MCCEGIAKSFNTKVLKFWVMEITNIYDFLQLLNLIRIRPNMDFGGEFNICTYMLQYIFFLFLSQRIWRKAHKQKPK